MPGDNRERELPEPIPNSEVKTFIADDSMVLHVKVGHRQAISYLYILFCWSSSTGRAADL